MADDVPLSLVDGGVVSPQPLSSADDDVGRLRFLLGADVFTFFSP